MDAAGNIDMYAERRLSLHAEKDLNFSAGESIRLKANKFITMYAGDTRGQAALDGPPADGEIRIQSAADMHIMSEDNLRLNVATDLLGEVGSNTELEIGGNLNVSAGSTVYFKGGSNVCFDSPNVKWRVSGKDTTVNDLVDFLDEFIDNHNDLVQKYNSHTHTQGNGNDLGGGGTTSGPNPTDQNAPKINDEGLAANPEVTDDETEFAPWTNRVPQHEPWPRVLMQDGGDGGQNSQNSGYQDNVDWIEQYDNQGQAGREDVGKVEGDETVERGRFWRR